MLSKEETYLQNFWKPTIGHQIIYKDKVVTIEYIDSKYPEQIKVKGVEEIVFLQDYSWKPSIGNMTQVLTDFGCVVYDGIIRVGKRSWKGVPTDIKDFAQLIREIRLIFHTERGKDPLETYFLDETN